MSVMSSPAPPDLLLWQRFQSGDFGRDEIAASRVLSRWQRSRDAGVAGDQPGPPVMALERLAEALETYAPLLAPGAPFDAFASEMAKAGFCGVLADSEGVVMARRIAEPFETKIARSHLIDGTVWSERTRGTNGIGTALEEQAPTSIVGVEHFEYRNHGLACYAAPIRDIRERVVAVLDATGPVSSAATHMMASVVATAAALEALIVARTYDAAIPGGLFELERLLERMPHATLLVESTGHLRRANARFRALLPGHAGSDLAKRLRPWLGEKRSEAAPDSSALAKSLSGYRVEFEPLGKPEDPFAALVHFSPIPSRRVWPAKPAEPPNAAFAEIVGSDSSLAEARARAARFAGTDLPVLLMAETGTGKELFARAIHAASARGTGPFVPVNCGAITPSLIESELFGYGPGAFTGATAGGRIGKLAAADRGTLFLDEIGEMSPTAQATMLRFLEDGTFYRVGEPTECRANVRLITATSRNLSKLVAEGRFRNDLYFRIRGLVLRLPALRDRTDRTELALAMLDRASKSRNLPKPLGLSRGALEWIERHDWPGNVRELRTALEYAVVLAGDSPRIERWHLPIEDEDDPEMGTGLRSTVERSGLVRALETSKGNLSDAARTLGVARSTLYRMMDRHGLRPGISD